MYITICPVIVAEISRAAKSDNAVLLLETVDMDQPAAVEFALLPSFCPGAGVVREQVFVARLRVTNRAVNEVSRKFYNINFFTVCMYFQDAERPLVCAFSKSCER